MLSRLLHVRRQAHGARAPPAADPRPRDGVQRGRQRARHARARRPRDRLLRRLSVAVDAARSRLAVERGRVVAAPGTGSSCAIRSGGTSSVDRARARRAVGRRVDHLRHDRRCSGRRRPRAPCATTRGEREHRGLGRRVAGAPANGCSAACEDTQTIAAAARLRRARGSAAWRDQVGRAQVERELRLEVGQRRVGHGLVGREAADEVGHRAQRRPGRPPRAATTRATSSGSVRSAWTVSAASGSRSCGPGRMSGTTTRQPSSRNASTTADAEPAGAAGDRARCVGHRAECCPEPSERASSVLRRCSCASSQTARRSIRSCWSASASCARGATAREYLRLSLGDRTGTLVAMVREGVDALSALCDAGAVRARGRPLRRAPALRRPDHAARAARRATRTSSTSTTCSTGRRARPTRWRPTCAS